MISPEQFVESLRQHNIRFFAGLSDSLLKNLCTYLSVRFPVKEYITPEQFDKYKRIGLELGFGNVESAPLVRSSYMAERSFVSSNICK